MVIMPLTNSSPVVIVGAPAFRAVIETMRATASR
jgi:hypothetical protein